MSQYDKVKEELRINPRTWLVTGVAGFIGSNLLRELLTLEQRVIGIDNFSTGHQANLNSIEELLDGKLWSNFSFIEGDILDTKICEEAASGVDLVLHQAALGSVPRSINDPLTSNNVNIQGFLNMLVASKKTDVERFIYAASSSTYGDHPDLPKVEDRIGKPLSPYAVTKLVNELYADVFHRTYNFNSIGLRYFNVFGPSQDPNGAYAAVIPKWIDAIDRGKGVVINGDGKTSRDFCFINNAVQANILAATSTNESSLNQVYNIAVGDQTSLVELYNMIQKSFVRINKYTELKEPIYGDFREGDVRHSLANIAKAKSLLGYEPEYRVLEGIEKTVEWYLSSKKSTKIDS